MAATTYFGNRARAAVVQPSATPALADLFTVTRGFEATFDWEEHELYGTDSINRVDEARSQAKYISKLRGCKFDPLPASTTGIGNKIFRTLNPTSYDGTVEDSNTLALFDVYIWQTGSATPATNRFVIKVMNAYIVPPISIPFDENEFIILDLTFKGRTGSIVNTGVPTS